MKTIFDTQEKQHADTIQTRKIFTKETNKQN